MFIKPFDIPYPYIHAVVSDFEWCTGPLFPWVIALYYFTWELLLKASQSGIYYHV